MRIHAVHRIHTRIALRVTPVTTPVAAMQNVDGELLVRQLDADMLLQIRRLFSVDDAELHPAVAAARTSFYEIVAATVIPLTERIEDTHELVKTLRACRLRDEGTTFCNLLAAFQFRYVSQLVLEVLHGRNIHNRLRQQIINVGHVQDGSLV